MRLLPLILISGCVSWTPNKDYYDASLEIRENERYIVEEDERNGTCYGTPLGTFSCADTLDFEIKYNDYTVLHQLPQERYYE